MEFVEEVYFIVYFNCRHKSQLWRILLDVNGGVPAYPILSASCSRIFVSVPPGNSYVALRMLSGTWCHVWLYSLLYLDQLSFLARCVLLSQRQC